MALALRSRSTGKGSALAVTVTVTEEAGVDGWQTIAAVAGEVLGTVVVDGVAATLDTPLLLLLLLLTVVAMFVLEAVTVAMVAVPGDVDADDC